MTAYQQLAMDAPKTPAPRVVSEYRAFAFSSKDAIPLTKRVEIVVEKYRERFGVPPREVLCHPSIAAELDAEVAGVAVIASQMQRDNFYVGPLEPRP